MVKDLVELHRKQPVDLGDAGVQHRLGVRPDRDRTLQHFGNELLDQVFAALPLRQLLAEASLLDDLVQEPDLSGFRRRFGG